MSASPAVPWRGYVNQITYGADLRAPVGEEVVERIASELIRQWFFTHPVVHYYDAAVAGLRSGERLAFAADDDEAATRDLLTRLVARLDERRPWPAHLFQQMDLDEWATLRGAPVVAHVPHSQRDVGRRLNRGFVTVDTGVDQAEVLILRLRSGQTVAIRSRGDGGDLVTRADPAATIGAFRELTGLEADPVR